MKITDDFLRENPGETAVFLPVADSTMSEWERRAKKGKKHAVIVCAEQTRGVGRSGKSFFSPKNSGLYMTFYFPGEKVPFPEEMTARSAVALQKAIGSVFQKECLIKWVNDLYFEERKIAGILCKKTDGGYLCGIGVNFYDPTAIPRELFGVFGSLNVAPDKATESRFLASLYRALCDALSADRREILSLYRERFFLRDRAVTVEFDQREYSGRCLGIADDFSLTVATGDAVMRFSSGTVRFENKI